MRCLNKPKNPLFRSPAVSLRQLRFRVFIRQCRRKKIRPKNCCRGACLLRGPHSIVIQKGGGNPRRWAFGHRYSRSGVFPFWRLVEGDLHKQQIASPWLFVARSDQWFSSHCQRTSNLFSLFLSNPCISILFFSEGFLLSLLFFAGGFLSRAPPSLVIYDAQARLIPPQPPPLLSLTPSAFEQSQMKVAREKTFTSPHSFCHKILFFRRDLFPLKVPPKSKKEEKNPILNL